MAECCKDGERKRVNDNRRKEEAIILEDDERKQNVARMWDTMIRMGGTNR